MSHTLPTGLGGLLLVVLPVLGWVYLIPVTWVTADLFWRNAKLIQAPTPQNARGLFLSSNIYLLVLLLAICIGTVVTAWVN
jgi:heme O synthase-like polyprenyltransferase